MRKILLVFLLVSLLWSPCVIFAGGPELNPNGVLKTPAGTPINYDKNTQSLTYVNYDHHEIHKGDAWCYTLATDVAGAGTSYDILLITSSSLKLPHLRPFYEVEAGFSFSIYEGTTYTSVGSPRASYSRNRAKVKNPGMMVFTGPTVATIGVLLADIRHGSGGGTGGGFEASNECILAANQTYLIRFTKEAAGTAYFSLELFWYEHEEEE